jgi:hypothetical protein
MAVGEQVLPIEMLNGVTFGCAWAAGTVHCSRIAPLGLEATTQSIYTVMPVQLLTYAG